MLLRVHQYQHDLDLATFTNVVGVTHAAHISTVMTSKLRRFFSSQQLDTYIITTSHSLIITAEYRGNH